MKNDLSVVAAVYDRRTHRVEMATVADRRYSRGDAPAPMHRRSLSRLGFTMVEILAALAFLGLVIPVAVSALMVSNRAAIVSERSLIATRLGENKLSELMIAQAWTSAESRGTFDDTQPGYRWELRHGDWQSGAMTELTLEVFFKVQGGEHSVLLTTLVSEDLTE